MIDHYTNPAVCGNTRVALEDPDDTMVRLVTGLLVDDEKSAVFPTPPRSDDYRAQLRGR